MRVDIKQTSTTYKLQDGEFKCQHDNIEIEPPCCTTADSDTGYISCACGGMASVYCPDCDNEDLTDDEIEFQIDSNWRLDRGR